MYSIIVSTILLLTPIFIKDRQFLGVITLLGLAFLTIFNTGKREPQGLHMEVEYF
jgi:hypothetical protein